MRAFQSFRGLTRASNLIWQESDSPFPYQCSQCQRVFEKGGKRWLGSTMQIHRMSHHAAAVLCVECKQGIDPHRRPAPILGVRKTELD